MICRANATVPQVAMIWTVDAVGRWRNGEPACLPGEWTGSAGGCCASAARRAPGGPPKAEPGADAGPAVPRSGTALISVRLNSAVLAGLGLSYDD